MLLVNRQPTITICTLGNVRDVTSTGDGRIAGKWSERLERHSSPPTSPLIAKFVAWHSSEPSILTFTQQYGPLYIRPEAGKPFEIRLEQWLNAQGVYRRLWKEIAESKNKYYEPSHSLTSGAFHLSGNDIRLQVDMLADRLSFELWLLDRAKLRVCGNPQCKRRQFFVAKHGKQAFCSQQCVDEMQREWKRKWWTENRGKKA